MDGPVSEAGRQAVEAARDGEPGRRDGGPQDGAIERLIDRLIDQLCALVEAGLAVLMVAMVAMVLGNVVLRYAFGTGIVVSEELSRLGLVWITFAGAVVAWRRGLHLGVDTVVVLLPARGRWLCALASEVAALVCCVLVVAGTAQQHDISATTTSLVAGIPLIWMYGMGYVAGAGIGALALLRLVRLLRGGPAALQAAQPAPAAEVVA